MLTEFARRYGPAVMDASGLPYNKHIIQWIRGPSVHGRAQCYGLAACARARFATLPFPDCKFGLRYRRFYSILHGIWLCTYSSGRRKP